MPNNAVEATGYRRLTADVLHDKMKKETFKKNLSQAVRQAIEIGQRFAIQILPADLLFDLYPNQSYDGNPLVKDEQLFPDDSVTHEIPIKMWTEDDIVQFLWRGEKVPEWIDVNVASATNSHTCLRFCCCGRFTATERLLYHRKRGIPPFSVKSPFLPPDYPMNRSAEVQKFDINWMEKRKDMQNQSS